MTKQDVINAIIASQKQPSDLPVEFDRLFDFITLNPDSETANLFAEYHLENHADSVSSDGTPSFTYLIGREFNVADWVAEEDQELFRKSYFDEATIVKFTELLRGPGAWKKAIYCPKCGKSIPVDNQIERESDGTPYSHASCPNCRIWWQGGDDWA